MATHGIDDGQDAAGLGDDLAVVVVHGQILQRLAAALLQMGTAGVVPHTVDNGGDAPDPPDGAGIVPVPGLGPQLLTAQFLDADGAGEAPHGRQDVAQVGVVGVEAGEGLLDGDVIGRGLRRAGRRCHGGRAAMVRAGRDAGRRRSDGVGQVRHLLVPSVGMVMMLRMMLPRGGTIVAHTAQAMCAGDAPRRAVIIPGVVLLLGTVGMLLVWMLVIRR